MVVYGLPSDDANTVRVMGVVMGIGLYRMVSPQPTLLGQLGMAAFMWVMNPLISVPIIMRAQQGIVPQAEFDSPSEQLL